MALVFQRELAIGLVTGGHRAQVQQGEVEEEVVHGGVEALVAGCCGR